MIVSRSIGSLGILTLLVGTTITQAEGGKLIREKVHGKSLMKNPANESADRNVSIYLPPRYESSTKKKYPVIYLLHGIGDTDQTWMSRKEDYANIKDVLDRGIMAGHFGEMIVVMPDQKTQWFGSFYTNSAWTGNWEDFTTQDLIAAIDGKYRTLPTPNSRAIVGHSMGGYGAIKLGMKHPDVFGVVYGMNPALLGWSADISIDNPAFSAILKMTKPQEVIDGGVYPCGILCVAQAFSPNPKQELFHVDFPFQKVNGKLQPVEPAFSKWEENMPINLVKRYRENLKKLRGIRFDSGWEDEFTHIVITSRQFSRTLSSYGIEHIFEEYNGDHRNRLWGKTGRIYMSVIPYCWQLLDSK